jgi:hypothetical protein
MPIVRRKRADSPNPLGTGWEAGVAEWERGHPELTQFLARTSYDDGGARQPGTLLVFTEAGGLKGCLSDRDQGLVAFATADAFLELLDTFERGLAGDTLDWRVSKQSAGAKQARKR